MNSHVDDIKILVHEDIPELDSRMMEIEMLRRKVVNRHNHNKNKLASASQCLDECAKNQQLLQSTDEKSTDNLLQRLSSFEKKVQSEMEQISQKNALLMDEQFEYFRKQIENKRSVWEDRQSQIMTSMREAVSTIPNKINTLQEYIEQTHSQDMQQRQELVSELEFDILKIEQMVKEQRMLAEQQVATLRGQLIQMEAQILKSINVERQLRERSENSIRLVLETALKKTELLRRQ